MWSESIGRGHTAGMPDHTGYCRHPDEHRRSRIPRSAGRSSRPSGRPAVVCGNAVCAEHGADTWGAGDPVPGYRSVETCPHNVLVISVRAFAAIKHSGEDSQLLRVWPPVAGVTVTNRTGSNWVTGALRWNPQGVGRRNLTLSVCALGHNWSVITNRLGRPRLARDWGVCRSGVSP